MADISLDAVKDFFSLRTPSRASALTNIKITGHHWDQGRNGAYKQQFKLPKKNPQSPPPSPAYVGEYCSTGPKLEDLYNEMEQLELDPPLGASDEIPAALKEEEATHIFENYSFDHTYPSDLPITCYQQQIVDTIESNSVTIVQGATGSGKTTQVPQYILDEYVKNQRYCNIIVTQPRRIAAISIAKRVCQERGWTLGSLVGYQVGRDKCLSEDTRLSYVTTGVLLQRLIQSKNMNQYTHVFLDEVHERDQDSDFCLLVVKKLLRTNSRHVKVILMSATIESDLFSMYFAVPVRGRVEGAPVVSVDGKSFPVVESYLDDLDDVGMIPDVTHEQPGIDRVGYELAARLVYTLDQLETTRNSGQGSRGTVLIFLPGYFEIEQMDHVLDEMCTDLIILPLHSRITTQEQASVFKKPPEGFRKVILATNIAESSITVPDIKYVIDFCLEKCLVCDPETNFQSLRPQWASKANCTQRKGRAGRVSTGTCYRMVTREFYHSCLPQFGIPEMQRCPLEQVVLKVKLLDIGPPKTVLRLALQPPDSDDIERTVLLLKQVGALTIFMKNGAINPCDGELTFIGKVLGSLPIDVHLGKLLVLAYVYGCLEECLVISASLSLQSFFANPFKREFDAYSKKMAWSDYSHSDCIAVLNAFKEWSLLKRRKGFPQGEVNWSQENMIQLGRIREVEQVVEELTERLKQLNLRTIRPLHQKASTQESLLILKLVICGAFYPNYFQSSQIDEADVMKTMSGHDPCTTVIVRNMPPNGILYRSAIARMFRQCGKGKAIYFEDSRAYIEFERPRIVDRGLESNSIVPAVYKAIKMRQLRKPLNLFISEAKNAQMDRLMEQKRSLRIATDPKKLRTNRMATLLSSRGTGSVELMEEPRQVNLPQKGYLEIVTSVVINAGHFWAQKPDSESARKLQMLQDNINKCDGRDLERIERRDLSVGTLCLALYAEDELLYRARVLAINDGKFPTVEVLYVDFGNEGVVKLGHLKKIKREFLNLPFQAFECRLCEVAPVPSAHCPVGAWSPRATQLFIELTENKKLAAKVYSLVKNVLHLDLYDTSTEEDVHINQVLIDEGFALFQEESRASKMANQSASSGEGLPADDNTAWIDPSIENEPNPHDDVTKVSLRGPESPIEMGFYSMTNIGRMKSVRIEQNSVNSVILNDQPQDPHERFLVAANIGVNALGTTIIARDTTLMPNIHGLMSLVALIFAPYAEMRVDREMRQYTGALVGLGFDPGTGEALLPDHDSELVFDVDVTEDDIIGINSLRTAINLAFQSEQQMGEWGTPAVERIQKASRSKILALVLKRREIKQPYPFPRAGLWNQIDPAYVLHAGGESETDAGLLYTLHKGVAISGKPLDDEDEEARLKVAELREKMEWLRSLEGRSSEQFTNEVICPLCNVVCRHPRAVSMHLRSTSHREIETSLYED